jgi:enamine deaminase RidA (YjgF/YER057c/UK114 family)
MSPEEVLASMGITLPPAAKPAGSYVPAVLTGSYLYVSGQGPRRPDGSFAQGVVGSEVTVAEGYERAKLCGIAILAVVKAELGSLDRVKRVVKVLGMVNAIPTFEDQPEVINGCSDLFIAVFGENGRHARSAVGMGSLPKRISVEVEAIFEVV